MTFEQINPEALGVPRGWTNGMLAPREGRMLFVAGQSAAGADGAMPDGMPAQWEQALRKIVTVVEAAGGDPQDIGRLTIFVTDLEAYRTDLGNIGAAYRRVMGKHFPAMALLHVAGLVEHGALVEIEATAWIPDHRATQES
jgi:enamine deaminase RidA (YjgF/YER057c/UK114 family)